MILDAQATAALLPYDGLTRAIESVLQDPLVQVPTRSVLPMVGGGRLLVMSAVGAHAAISKLITFVGDNPSRGLPTIQGDVLVFDPHSGQRLLILDGPTVTARRTAAVSLVAAQRTGQWRQGPMLIVGAGVQGRSHLEAFHVGLGITEFWIASRSSGSADALVSHARGMGLQAKRVDDPNAAMSACGIVVTATSAHEVAMTNAPANGTFVSAVGAFTPQMAEWSRDACQALSNTACLLVDTRDADHEGGDLIQAGLNVAALPTLSDVVLGSPAWRVATDSAAHQSTRTVFFKSCGWAGWDLAAAQCALANRSVL